MDFSKQIDTTSIALPTVYFKGSQVEFCQSNDKFQSLPVVLILTYSADPDEMQHVAAFHLGRHCLPKFPV